MNHGCVSCCDDFTVFKSVDGGIWVIGAYKSSVKGSHIPTQIHPSGIVGVSCGPNNVLFLDNHKKVWTCGKSRATGAGDTFPRAEPQKLSGMTSIKSISSGSSFSLCIGDDDSIYTFGLRVSTKLIEPENKHILRPTKIPQMKIIIESIFCGLNHILALTKTNSLYGTGSNEGGMLGSKEAIKEFKSFELIKEKTNFISIDCGNQHSLFLSKRGKVYSSGLNRFGQLGIRSRNTMKRGYLNIKSLSSLQITEISCHMFHSLCIDINGNLWSFGRNHCGQLGTGDTNNRENPFHVSDLSSIIYIAKGQSNSSIVMDDSENLWVFGNNQEGQLGFPSPSLILKPLKFPLESKEMINYKHNHLLKYTSQVKLDNRLKFVSHLGFLPFRRNDSIHCQCTKSLSCTRTGS